MQVPPYFIICGTENSMPHTVPRGFTDASLSGRKFSAMPWYWKGHMRDLKQHMPHTVPRGFTDASLSGRKFSAMPWYWKGHMRDFI